MKAQRYELLGPDTSHRRLARIACVMVRYHSSIRVGDNHRDYDTVQGEILRASTVYRSYSIRASSQRMCSKPVEYSWDTIRSVAVSLRKVLEHRDAVGKAREGFGVGVRDFYEMLVDIIKTGKRVRWGWCKVYDGNRYCMLCVDTDPIVLYDEHTNMDFKLGPMEMQYILGKDGVEVQIEPIEPYWDYRNEYFHPHVSGGGLCMGDGGAAVNMAMSRGDVYSVFEIVESILGEYNPDSPYRELEDWDSSGGECVCCGGSIEEGEGYSCNECGESPMCAECSYYCEACGESYCSGCFGNDGHGVVCSECGTLVCTGCVCRCSCGTAYCRDCVDDILRKCKVCGNGVCTDCGTTCDMCGDVVCSSCIHECDVCGSDVCEECLVRCEECESPMCKACSVESNDGRVLCPDCKDSIDDESEVYSE